MDNPKSQQGDEALTILFDAVGRSGGEQMRNCLRLFAGGLLKNFECDQVASILKGYVNSGKLETMQNEDVVREAYHLNDLWKAKLWSEEVSENFQISLLTRQEWEGVPFAFEHHPAYRHLTGKSESKDSIGRRPFSVNLREQWEESESNLQKSGDSKWRGKSGDQITVWDRSESVQNDNNKPRIVFTEEEDSEIIRDSYEVYENLVEHCEEIESIAEHSKKGVIFVHEMRLTEGAKESLSSKFDLLRSFLVNRDCMIRLEIGRNIPMSSSRESNLSPRWIKEFEVHSNIWYNFAEQMIPLDGPRLDLKMSITSCNSEIIILEVMGVCLAEEERCLQSTRLARFGLDPYAFGFRRQFRIKI